MRRATGPWTTCSPQKTISIHALREEGDLQAECLDGRNRNISIHALREEGDLREAIMNGYLDISIHALREEGDIPGMTFIRLPRYFYPRPP